MRIPLDPIGYSVNQATGTIHTRYAGEHAGNAIRTRTVKGVETLLNGKTPKVCEVCYPSPQYDTPAPPRPPQQRRTGPISERPPIRNAPYIPAGTERPPG